MAGQDNIIELRGVDKSFEDTRALEGIDLSISNGEFLTLLGPSGCGKTTILRILSGFETPDRGDVSIAGQRMNGVPPERRQVNTVFQNYALFPHMTVRDNVAFGLRMQSCPKSEIEGRVLEALRMVHLEQYADRRPHQLSGGQQQRVAIARAVVNKPLVLLLDEPFTPRISPEEIKGRLRRLSAMGPQTVVATSVPLLEGGRDPGRNASVIAYERNEDRFWRIDCAYIPAHYPGTGDTFSSVLTGSLIQGDSLSIALDRAVQFVTLGIRATFGQGLPSREGILLERILGSLFAPVSACKCRLMDGDGCHTPAAPFEG
jgi:ABC-type nitrate/sulfonate/bicarbonate transport system ATPase subunit